MCLIVDVNVAEAVLIKRDDPNFKEVHAYLFTTKLPPARLVYGGQLALELRQNTTVARILRELDRAGRTRTVLDESISAECETLSNQGLCVSNDVHILALARAGQVRLLCSHDQALHADFCNKRILDKPRGKVYSCPEHRKLLILAHKNCPYCNPKS